MCKYSLIDMPLEDNKSESLVSTETPHELESQFILRLPSLSAASLRAAVKSGQSSTTISLQKTFDFN